MYEWLAEKLELDIIRDEDYAREILLEKGGMLLKIGPNAYIIGDDLIASELGRSDAHIDNLFQHHWDESDAALQSEMRKLLEGIAKRHLFISTLKTRGSDALDFHEVSVWGVKSALESAFALGQIASSVDVLDYVRKDK